MSYYNIVFKKYIKMYLLFYSDIKDLFLIFLQ